ncbi:Mce-associated membrane protein [Streptomyces sp. DvalAA-14]|uniref:hypothetical protein n=1 Tax=unclassified Streptomyces TaxID=2593676 RepID=UPI00081B2F8B|nr:MULTISPECIES: hypothetical protein [unclassified Streptomyces]MYS21253.1 hypothetical protein [Streptomyces sp. SID4948]SCD88124.1 Mce-associated membrane protein [Streptomyces sp. DvalAA-14]
MSSSTTRHLINRQRRLAAAAAAPAPATRTAAAPASARLTDPSAAPDPTTPAAPEPAPEPGPESGPEPAPAPASAAPARRRRFPRGAVPIAALALLTVLLGGFAAWASGKASALRDTSAAHNTALTDTARTSEVKGTVAQDVNTVFSYDYADPARTDDAARRMLTGKAVQQYATLIAQVKAQAAARKLVLTTTVTDTGVEMIDGDRARVLVFADQRNTSTAAAAGKNPGDDGTTVAAAMFAVDAVRQDSTWKIATIDTFG